MTFIPSPYFSSRNGKKIDGVVIHTTVGFYEGTINYFKNNDRKVSAHYVTSLNGNITQMVREENAAHHAGIISNPTSPVYKGFNPNWNTIGIENADDNNPHGADRSKQLPALASLVRDICNRNGIPIDKYHICGHRELYDKKTCPGNIDVNEVIRLAKGGDDEMITDQTKIPQIENKEVQQIRSELLAKDSKIYEQEKAIDSLTKTVNDLTAKSKEANYQLEKTNQAVADLSNKLAFLKDSQEKEIEAVREQLKSDNNSALETLKADYQRQLESAKNEAIKLASIGDLLHALVDKLVPRF